MKRRLRSTFLFNLAPLPYRTSVLYGACVSPTVYNVQDKSATTRTERGRGNDEDERHETNSFFLTAALRTNPRAQGTSLPDKVDDDDNGGDDNNDRSTTVRRTRQRPQRCSITPKTKAAPEATTTTTTQAAPEATTVTTTTKTTTSSTKCCRRRRRRMNGMNEVTKRVQPTQ